MNTTSFVTLMYTCEAGNEGCEIELGAGARRCSATVEEAFDSPVKDRENCAASIWRLFLFGIAVLDG